jgi:xanthine dehydrogenase accessory factor
MAIVLLKIQFSLYILIVTTASSQLLLMLMALLIARGPIGAYMAIFENGHKVGTLSSGCIESDLVMQSKSVLQSGSPLQIRYGRGSPFLDLHLPCGGGLEILLVPRPDRAILAELNYKSEHRVACV